MTEEHITKKKIDIELILKHYDKETKDFKFGEVVKTISLADVNNIFGLPTEGKDFTFNKKEPKAQHERILKYF